MSNLNPQQFPALFHGTIHPLEGDTLTPGHKWGATTVYQDPWKAHGQSRHDYVSATDDEANAWNFAANARAQNPSSVLPRTRVHEVEPNAETKIGVEHVDHPVLQRAFAEKWWKKPDPNGEHVAPSFTVKQTHDAMPGHQGTFPEENWNEYRAKGASDDANHPHGEHGGPRRNFDRVYSLAQQKSPDYKQVRQGREMNKAENESIAKGQGTLF